MRRVNDRTLRHQVTTRGARMATMGVLLKKAETTMVGRSRRICPTAMLRGLPSTRDSR